MRFGLGVGLVLGVLAYGGGAWSQPRPRGTSDVARQAQVQSLLRDAQSAVARGDHAGALANAERIERISAEPSVLMFIAEEHQALYHPEESRAYARRCIQAIETRGPVEREMAPIQQRCRELLGAADAALGVVRLVMPDQVPVGTRVFVGGTVVPQEQWERPRSIQTGQIEVEATAPGHLVWRQVVTVRGRETSEVRVQLERVPDGVVLPCPQPPDATTTPSPSRAGPITLLVSGGVLLGVGAALAVFVERPLVDDYNQCSTSAAMCSYMTPEAARTSNQRLQDMSEDISFVRRVEFSLMGFGLGTAVGGLFWLLGTPGRPTRRGPSGATVTVLPTGGAMFQIGGAL